jgi:hypothetical protein
MNGTTTIRFTVGDRVEGQGGRTGIVTTVLNDYDYAPIQVVWTDGTVTGCWARTLSLLPPAELMTYCDYRVLVLHYTPERTQILLLLTGEVTYVRSDLLSPLS